MFPDIWSTWLPSHHCHQTPIRKGPGWIQRKALDWSWVKRAQQMQNLPWKCPIQQSFQICEWKDDGRSERIVLDSKQGPGRFGVCTVSNITGFLVNDTNLLVFVWIRCDCAQTAFLPQRRQGPDNWCEALSNCSFIFSCVTLCKFIFYIVHGALPRICGWLYIQSPLRSAELKKQELMGVICESCKHGYIPNLFQRLQMDSHYKERVLCLGWTKGCAIVHLGQLRKG